VYSDRYLAFITQELIPHIEQRFEVSRAREDRMIAGSSMGALISLYAVSEYPTIFGGAACLSTHWIGFYQDDQNNPVPQAFQRYVLAQTPEAGQHRWYFDYGTQTLDANYKSSQLLIDQTMYAKGYRDDDYVSREFVGADHSERAWSARLHIPLTFLFKPQGR
jgi:enterochelin esterase-like enzyme